MKKVAGSIQRKSMLYQTGVEYGDYTMNHVLGCAHGCNYPCYAYLQKKRFKQVKDYANWCEPYLVSNTIELLTKEIPRYKRKIKSVHLCFTTDPFMYEYDEVIEMSLNAIELLNKHGIKCTVLTKGILPLELANKLRYPAENEYGITLVSLNEAFRKKMEPNTSQFEDRINALKKLSDLGCKTWVSMEPYPTPNICKQDLSIILERISFVDKIIFGRMNYNSDVRKGYPDHKNFYNEVAKEVVSFCEKKGIDYHIKKKTIAV